MNIYLVSRTDDWDYDQFDSFVCIAENEDRARMMVADFGVADFVDGTELKKPEFLSPNDAPYSHDDWIEYDEIDSLEVRLIGKSELDKECVVIGSFNAG